MFKVPSISGDIRNMLRISLPVILIFSNAVKAREYTFDTEILHQRGIDPGVNTHFANEAKYLPGQHSVSLNVNGKDKGTLAVRFGAEGQLCVDNEFLTAAGLLTIKNTTPEECHDYREDYPSATITPLPNMESLRLVVPAEAVNSGLSMIPGNVQRGGTAAVLNYSLFGTSSRYDGGSSEYRQAALEGGVNFADWVLRSNYVFTDNNGTVSANSLFTYVAHTFVEQKMQLQAGQVNAVSGLFSGAPINGIQLSPARELIADDSGVTVSGVARGAQARVEVRQTGQLIYSTLVPAGPFNLTNVPIVRTNTDLDITVVEADGSSNHFVIPASTLRAGRLSRPLGLSMSLGQIRGIKSDYDLPVVANVSNGWRLAPTLTLSASGVLAANYQAAGAELNYLPFENWMLGGNLLTSKASFSETLSGVKNELITSYSPVKSLSVSLSAAKYSEDYRELTDALDDNYTSYDNSYSAALSWSNNYLGTFSLGYNLNQASDAQSDTRYINASWGKMFKYASVRINWQTQVGNTDKGDENEDLMYVNISIPFGSQDISTHYRRQGERSSAGVSTSSSITQNSSYSISVDREIEDLSDTFNGNINANLHYTQFSVGGGGDNHQQRNANATLSGGVVFHDKGVTFSPYKVKDTFAIARLSDPVSGVEMSTPKGTIWTDAWGQAVVPDMALYRNTRIEIDPNSLPQSMDLANGTKMVAVGHGSVSEVGFRVMNSRRVMIEGKRADGTKLSKGSSVVDEKGNYIVTVVDDGHVFINDIEGVKNLYVTDDDGHRQCQLYWTLADKQDKEVFYEETEGVCR